MGERVSLRQLQDHSSGAVQEVAQQCQIRAMPTFQVYSKGQKVEEIVGGNLGALKAACEKYGSQTSFQGIGHTLSGNRSLCLELLMA